MFFTIGMPQALSAVKSNTDLNDLKAKIKIAIIDDEPFEMAKNIRSHRFDITELGDIKSVDMIASYPIVICDIKGVGQSFGSSLGGAHLLSEIRKAYPDKFLISYSGASHDIRYNESIRKADVSVPKDSTTEVWITVLEKGLRAVGDPKERWVRFRSTLLEKDVDIYDVFLIEQAFIKSVDRKNTAPMDKVVVPEIVKDLVSSFVGIALKQVIEGLQ